MVRFDQLCNLIPGVNRSSDRYHPDINDMDGKELEQRFIVMKQEERLEFVSRRKLPPDKWDEFTIYVDENGNIREKWGKGGQHVFQGQCLEHQANVTERVIYTEYVQSSGRSTRKSDRLVGGFGVNVGITARTEGRSSTSEEATESEETAIGNEKIVTECQTGSKDCKINRRAFINAGDFLMVSGIPSDDLDRRFSIRIRISKRIA